MHDTLSWDSTVNAFVHQQIWGLISDLMKDSWCIAVSLKVLQRLRGGDCWKSSGIDGDRLRKVFIPRFDWELNIESCLVYRQVAVRGRVPRCSAEHRFSRGSHLRSFECRWSGWALRSKWCRSHEEKHGYDWPEVHSLLHTVQNLIMDNHWRIRSDTKFYLPGIIF